MSKPLTHWTDAQHVKVSLCRCSECEIEYVPSAIRDFYTRSVPATGQPLVCQRCVLKVQKGIS